MQTKPKSTTTQEKKNPYFKIYIKKVLKIKRIKIPCTISKNYRKCDCNNMLKRKKKTNATDFLVPQVIGDSNLKDINK